MVNKISKEQAMEALIELRDGLIEANSRKGMPLQDRWFEPDCLEYAIDFLEKHKEAIER